MSYMLQPQILLLKDGSDQSQGKGQIISNINACQSIVEVVKTTLGPRGMDKMISQGNQTTITNDGATILNLLEIIHPAAKTLVDIAKSQDNEVGDGTTTVTLLAGELLKESKKFVEEGMHSQIIIKGLKSALQYVLKKLSELSKPIDVMDPLKKREMLIKCAETALNSKLLANYKNHFAELVVSSVEKLDLDTLDKDMIGIKLVTGGSITESFAVNGVAFKKTFAYAGFEQQPKKIKEPKICLLNLELELKSEKENAEIRISKPEEYQQIIDAEWQIIYNKLDAIVKVGANVVLSKLPIGDLATQYFADRNIFCAGRVPKEDMQRLVKATGGVIQTTVNGIKAEVLGGCGFFEEVQLGAERYNLFKDCLNSKTATIVIRGGAEQFIQEAERSLNDAIMIVRRAIKADAIVPGAGSIELELSKHLRLHSRENEGKAQLVMNSYAKALEVIPRTIADNAGLDSVEILNKLRQRHATDSEDGPCIGVGIDSNDGLVNAYTEYIWEPLLVKKNALIAATEAACLILSIDETVRNPKAEQDSRMKQSMPGGMPGGMPGMGMRAGGPPGLAQNMKLK